MSTARTTLLAALVLAMNASPASANWLENAGFEDVAPGLSLPSGAGIWEGDFASRVSAENGITPVEGSFMLRLDGTFYTCPEGGSGSDLHQLFVPASGGGRARFSVRVNRVFGDVQTDTLFQVRIRAYQGDPGDFDANEPNLPGPLAEEVADLISDGNVATWQDISVELDVPSDADYLAVVISAVENVFNDHTCPIGEFDGHYADDARLTAVAAVPAVSGPGCLMLVIALVSFGTWRLRSQR
jgi:hypothetical protein